MLSEFTVALLEDSGTRLTTLHWVESASIKMGKGMQVLHCNDNLLIQFFVYVSLGCSFLNKRCNNQSVHPYLLDLTL